MIERVSGVALNTFRESVRDKVLVTLVAFAVLVMGSARVIQPLALGEEAKVIKDLGLSAITLFCVLISILIGGRIVYKEVEKRTIYIMLAKPVRRWEFILGKYLGLMAVLVVSLAVMTAAFYAILLVLGVGVQQPVQGRQVVRHAAHDLLFGEPLGERDLDRAVEGERSLVNLH